MPQSDAILLALVMLLPCHFISSLLSSALPTCNIMPSPCPNNTGSHSCLTLQQFATTDHSQYTSTDSILLFLHPGNHSLTSEIKIKDVKNLTISADHGTKYSWIICNNSGRFAFEGIHVLTLNNMVIFGCENSVVKINKAVIIGILLRLTGGRRMLSFTTSNVTIVNCSFAFVTNNQDEVADSTMLVSNASNLSISTSIFVTKHSIALLAEQGSIINITNTTFCDSNVTQNGENSTLIVLLNATVKLENSIIKNNTGQRILSARSSRIEIANSSIVKNSGYDCILCAVRSNISLKYTNISKNLGNFSILYLVKTDANLSGNTFTYNDGSFLIKNSIVTFNGTTVVKNCTQRNVDSLLAEGTITVFQSTINFHELTTFSENYSAKSGGAIYVLESLMSIFGTLNITNNSARYGGGAFLYLSNMFCYGFCIFSHNKATKSGGGIHAVSMSVILKGENMWTTSAFNGSLTITDNEANVGGGMNLEMNSKLHSIGSNTYQYTIEFARNKANDKGGAIFIDDKTYPLVCASESFAHYSAQTECFFQALYYGEDIGQGELIQHITFTNNLASNGSILYGGLLDRCTLSPVASIYDKTLDSTTQITPVDALSYLLKESGLGSSLDEVISDEVMSDPLRICFCQKNMTLNCSYKPPTIHVKKGEEFSVTVVAVDQVNHRTNATVHSSLLVENILGEGQQLQESGECTNLTFNITSPHESVELVLFVDNGPCKNLGLSNTSVIIKFKECTCPLGFQQAKINNKKCECECAQKLLPFTQMCDPKTQSFVKNDNTWIGYINNSNNTGYLIHPNCPYDFCLPPGVQINLNEPDGADVQCAYNRAGLLCGKCKPGFWLSVENPHCIHCSTDWIVKNIVIILAGAICGIMVVALSLLLSLTVALGTFNGLIFYANIVIMSRSIFLPFSSPNFVTVFINWLNMKFGLERCLSKSTGVYEKTWLSFMHPLYLLILVVTVIMLNKCSSRCARLIGKRNPVATLATLILLMYAELLQRMTEILSYTILEYPDGSSEVVWRPDASVKYFKGKHIPLFLTAVVIVTIGLAYTILLFSWQWLLRVPSNI